MEFYLQSKPQNVQDTRFNSQRDGILLIRVRRKVRDHRFNSQRDGILLFDRMQQAQHHNVSIPNGMEFYV